MPKIRELVSSHDDESLHSDHIDELSKEVQTDHHVIYRIDVCESWQVHSLDELVMVGVEHIDLQSKVRYIDVVRSLLVEEDGLCSVVLIVKGVELFEVRQGKANWLNVLEDIQLLKSRLIKVELGFSLKRSEVEDCYGRSRP